MGLPFSMLIVFHGISSQEINNETGCICVPFYRCRNGTLNKRDEGIIDIGVSPDDVCYSYFEYCCTGENLLPLTHFPRVPSAAHGCGYRNPDGVGFKIPGRTDDMVQFGEFPWMIAILKRHKTEQNHSYICGGSLIHPQVVLTAAHCVNGIGDHFKIRAGEWDSQLITEMYQHEERNVSSVVIHPQYNKKNLANDIALLFLQEPLITAGHINNVCLPRDGTVAGGSGCFATGWGKTNFDSRNRYQSVLKKVELPVMAREACQDALRSTRLGMSFQLDPTFMCAGGEEGVDNCTGDSGGPLVCPTEGQENRYQQVGIVAWAISCGQKSLPGVFVDVAYFRNWIDGQQTS